MKLHALTILASFALTTPSLADYRNGLPKAHTDPIDIDKRQVRKIDGGHGLLYRNTAPSSRGSHRTATPPFTPSSRLPKIWRV